MTSSLKWQLLPAAFRAVDVMSLFQLSSHATTKTLHRWHHAGHISRLGKRLDVYTNNAKCEHASTRVSLMLNRLHPFATYCGPSVLQSYGWSTQLTPMTYCLLPRLTKNIHLQESDVVLLKRCHRWWKAMTPFITDKEGTTGFFPSRHLKPEALLAEAVLTTDKHGDAMDLWSPHVDDLDFYTIDEQVTDTDWYAAFAAVARFYKKTLPPPAASKEEWYEQLRHGVLSSPTPSP